VSIAATTKVESQQLNVSRGQVRHVPLFKNLVRIPYRVCHSHQTPSLDWQLTVSLGHKKIPTKNSHLPLEHFVSISQTRTPIGSFWREFLNKLIDEFLHLNEKLTIRHY
jgi:hypothetical protein